MYNNATYKDIGEKVKKYYKFKRPQSRRKKATLTSREAPTNKSYSTRCEILREVSRSFGKNIYVLDVGCGDGRFFHCLENTELLLGVDISPEMLETAKNPVCKQNITIKEIELQQRNIFEADFPNHSFSLIYSVGVLGEHSPFDPYICEKFFDWLEPGGKLFFTVVDVNSKKKHRSFKRKSIEFIYPFLPTFLKSVIDKRWAVFYMTESELDAIMTKSKFSKYEIHRNVADGPSWKGAHFECLATK